MSKSTSTSSTPSNPFAMDPQALMEQQRQAMLAGIEGISSVQRELHKATQQGLARMQAELQGWAKASAELSDESLSTLFDLSNRGLQAARDELARFGKPAQA